jgi:hypothetical protein
VYYNDVVKNYKKKKNEREEERKKLIFTPGFLQKISSLWEIMIYLFYNIFIVLSGLYLA